MSSASTRWPPRSRCSRRAGSRSTSPAWPSWSTATPGTAGSSSPPTWPRGSPRPSWSSSPSGRPQGDDGGANLSGIWAVGREIARNLTGPKIVIIKSTVPGRHQRRAGPADGRDHRGPLRHRQQPRVPQGRGGDRRLQQARPRRRRRPAGRGLRDSSTTSTSPFLRTERPFLDDDPGKSAEMTKYVANCLLATKISFINEMANLCERYHADINDVRRGIGHDQRIGFSFLFPGVGYGGSCFPKDIRAMIHMAQSVGFPARDDGGRRRGQQRPEGHPLPEDPRPLRRLERSRARPSPIWGLAFKPRTDDIREAPALVLIDAAARRRRLAVRVHDPEALANVKRDLRGSPDLLRPPLRSARAGRRPGDRHRVERVPQPRLRGHAPPAPPARHLRRPEPLRPGPDGRARLPSIRGSAGSSPSRPATLGA